MARHPLGPSLFALSLQLKVAREASPGHGTDNRRNSDSANGGAERPLASPAAGAASYGASTMGITIQPSRNLAAGNASDDDSMGEASPSRSPSPARDASHGAAAVQVPAQQPPVNAFAAQAAQQSGLSPHRVSILRGGPVAGSYVDGRYALHAYAVAASIMHT